MSERGLLIVLSGLSGAGKGTICKRLLEKYPDDYVLSVSATTRKPREGEVEGREYFFKEREEFEEMINAGELLEYASYVGNYYGTPKEWVFDQMQNDKNVILEIETQGAFQIQKLIPEAILVFVKAPSMEELFNRLVGRGTESIEVINERITRAEEELLLSERYDYIITNEVVENSVDMLHNIVLVNKERQSGE